MNALFSGWEGNEELAGGRTKVLQVASASSAISKSPAYDMIFRIFGAARHSDNIMKLHLMKQGNWQVMARVWLIEHASCFRLCKHTPLVVNRRK